MELVPYPGKEDWPRKFWQHVYTEDEKKARSVRNREYSNAAKMLRPVSIQKTPKTTPQKRAKVLADAAFNSAGRAVPACLTKQDRDELETVYLDSIELSGAGTKYSVDHIYPLGGQKYGVSGLHVRANLAVIPLIENMAKNNRPHPSWTDYAASTTGE